MERGRRIKGRYRATSEEWEEFRRVKLYNRPCRLPSCPHRAVSFHHLIGRDLLGDDMLENLIEVCGTGTTGCHGKLQELDPGTCSQLRSVLTSAEIAAASLKLGRDWLDRWYPPPNRAA